MTLKEELEILRGEPIKEWVGDPLTIPYIETSDPEKLCKNPVVSVHMITYNHEPYIRQAIEGVMMQKTDFEFELVIGEDASTDKTREICFEYQKKYPDKIRVLWWHENLYRNPHPAGGNGARNSARCRGEYIAFCEGDDYWTDSNKLQKQVDIMRAKPTVGLVFGNARILHMGNGAMTEWSTTSFPAGFMSGDAFFRIFAWGAGRSLSKFGTESFIMTASVLIKSRVFFDAIRKFDALRWRLAIGDAQTWLGCAALSDVFYLTDSTCVYRVHAGGAMASNGAKTMRDGILVRIYFSIKAFRHAFEETIARFRDVFAVCQLNAVRNLKSSDQRALLNHYLRHPFSRQLFLRVRTFPALIFMWLGIVNRWTALWISRIIIYMPRMRSVKCQR